MTVFWTQEKRDILITYLRNGLNNKVIAKKMNVTLDALSSAIRRYNLQDHIVPKLTTKKFLDNINFDDLKEENFEELKKEAKLIWNIPKATKIKRNKNFKTTLFWPDTHIPHQNNSACKAILKIMDDIAFDNIVIMGDYMDLGCISHWNKNRHKTLEMKRLKSDYVIGNALLDEIDKRLPKKCEKHYLKGNHEEWSDQLVEEMPALEGLIEPESMLFLKERGYKIHQYNELVKFGRLYATHGMYATANPIKKHLDELKVNIIFGHTHTVGMKLSASPAREIAFAGYNIGCICDLAPDYMKNRPNSWAHGFAIGYFYPNGYFDIEVIRILQGKFIFNEKIYDGNK